MWFLGGLGSWFGAFGLQSVVFPWLAAVVLGLPPERLGLVQMALMAPSIVFTLLGGVIADRRDTRCPAGAVPTNDRLRPGRRTVKLAFEMGDEMGAH